MRNLFAFTLMSRPNVWIDRFISGVPSCMVNLRLRWPWCNQFRLFHICFFSDSLRNQAEWFILSLTLIFYIFGIFDLVRPVAIRWSSSFRQEAGYHSGNWTTPGCSRHRRFWGLSVSQFLYIVLRICSRSMPLYLFTRVSRITFAPGNTFLKIPEATNYEFEVNSKFLAFSLCNSDVSNIIPLKLYDIC